jgi:hypothetical protein
MGGKFSTQTGQKFRKIVHTSYDVTWFVKRMEFTYCMCMCVCVYVYDTACTAMELTVMRGQLSSSNGLLQGGATVPDE